MSLLFFTLPPNCPLSPNALHVVAPYAELPVRYSSTRQAQYHESRIWSMSALAFDDHVTPSVNTTEKNRPSGNYKPSTWDYRFLKSLSTHHNTVEESHLKLAEKLKDEVKCMIKEPVVESLAKLELIDIVQRLGLKYHFAHEIKEVLSALYTDANDAWWVNNLHAAALRFRLLRENRMYVPQDVFGKFMDVDGGLKEQLQSDVRGILSLYEASFLGWENESLLDEAKAFTTKHLNNVKDHVSPVSLAFSVNHALNLPLHFTGTRYEARRFIEEYEKWDEVNPSLLKLAKLDFNSVQSIHQKELDNLASWWTGTGLDKLDLFRNSLMQNYLWLITVAFEPKFTSVRAAAVKQACLITMIDDIYDVFGTMEELEIFTDAVDRWDINGIDKLPRHISMILLVMFNTANEIGYELLKDRGFNGIPYVGKGWGMLCKAYMKEARWLHSGYKPTLEEYLENGLVSISLFLLLNVAYLQTEENLTTESAENVYAIPPLVRFSGLLNRVYNDLGTSSAEIARGDNIKAIQCYMSETGATEEAARDHINKLVHKYWKGMNKCLFEQTPFAEPYVSFNENSVRGALFFFQHGDGYSDTESWTKDFFMSILINPIAVHED